MFLWSPLKVTFKAHLNYITSFWVLQKVRDKRGLTQLEMKWFPNFKIYGPIKTHGPDELHTLSYHKHGDIIGPTLKSLCMVYLMDLLILDQLIILLLFLYPRKMLLKILLILDWLICVMLFTRLSWRLSLIGLNWW